MIPGDCSGSQETELRSQNGNKRRRSLRTWGGVAEGPPMNAPGQ